MNICMYDTECIHDSVTDITGFMKTLIGSRQALKHTWEYLTDKNTPIHYYSQSKQENTLAFTIQKKTVPR